MTAASERKRDEALALMQTVMRGREADNGCLAAEYPSVLGQAAGQHSGVLALEDAGAVRSACAVAAREFVCGAQHLRVGLIGSVATQSDWRGRGLASRLLAQAESELAGMGCMLALLWADDARFYLSRGWRPMGSEWDAWLPRTGAERLPRPAGCVRELSAAELDHEQGFALHALHHRHDTRVARTLAEHRALLGIPGMKLLALERDGQFVAYACCGRGSDLTGVLHEWGGRPQDVLSLARQLLETGAARSAGLVLMCTADESGMLEELDRRGMAREAGILGLGKVIDLAATGLWLEAQAGEKLRCTLIGEQLRCNGPLGSLELDRPALLELLAAPRGERHRAREVERVTGVALPGLPMGLFAWGLDSL